MSIKSYRELIVWKKAMIVVEDIYKLTKNFPNEEKFGLTSQIRRAVISIPSNIAEGQTRNSTKEFKQFLYIAKASNAEVETQLELAFRLKYIDNDNFDLVILKFEEISKMLQSLVTKLK
ncbi:MAG: four helix bundle protein [Candidatus Delongbacteria bacterium]|jgi:four helix bundle protein|nr:four helix bundle protein [Candidatus Delongbacteria bacterium]